MGIAVDWCLRCKVAGHEVKYFIRHGRDGTCKPTGKGVLDIVEDWQATLQRWRPDLVFVSDNAYYMTQLQPYHDAGFPIFGSNKVAAEWETHREVGQKLFKDAGLDVIPSKLFQDYASAAHHVRKREQRMVSKPNGDADKSMTYCAPSKFYIESMCYMLEERWAKNPKYRSDARQHGFILQEFIPGIEMGVSGYFGPGGWCAYFTEHWEHKKLFAGDRGPATGEMGTVIRYVRKSKLVDAVLKPLTKALHAAKYVGDFAVNCIIDEKGSPRPLEVTTRPGWPSWMIETALRRGDPAQWMRDLCDGFDTFECSDEVAIGLVVAMPDFPYSRMTGKLVEGVPVFGFDLARHHPAEMMLTAKGWATSGDYVCVATGTGKTVSGARRSALAAEKALEIPNNPFCREDVGKKLQQQLPLLQKQGFALNMEY